MPGLSKNTASGLDFAVAGETGAPRHMLVLLHGLGMNAAHMQAEAEKFAEKLPGTLVLIPDAPYTFDQVLPRGQVEAIRQSRPDFDWTAARSWQSRVLLGCTPEESVSAEARGATAPAVRALNALIDGQLKKYGLKDKDLALYGYSQGGAVALQAALGRPEPCAGVVSHSGYFMGTDEACVTPEILLIAGERELAEGQAMRALHEGAKAGLRARGLAPEECVCADLAHGMNAESFGRACGFIGQALGPPPPGIASPAARPKGGRGPG